MILVHPGLFFWGGGADNIKIEIHCVISGMEGDQTCHL